MPIHRFHRAGDIPHHARHNRGAVSVPKRRRNEDPMAAYDRLPAPLRGWLQQACLPWSARSCRRIWQSALREGLSTEDALARLDHAEAKLLERDTAKAS